jgi:hypothetical protein
MQPGDTLNIRGAHAGFDGTYFEEVYLAKFPPAGLAGKALACTSTTRCVIQGCRAATCGQDEVPIIRGMRLRADWINRGAGIYSRTMEATPHGDTVVERSGPEGPFEPHLLIQNDRALGYAHDTVTTPPDGQWSFHPATNTIYVNPIGSADPATAVYVPHHGRNVFAAGPTAHVTLRHLTVEGSRSQGMDLGDPVSGGTPGLVVQAVTVRHWKRFGIHAHTTADLLVEDSVIEHGARGISYFPITGDGGYGFRVFTAPGGILRRNVIRHVGATGACRMSSLGTCQVGGAACCDATDCPSGACTGAGKAWPCAWCDAPWNTAAATRFSSTGMGIQVKQTEGFLIEENDVSDISTLGYSIDVSRHVTVQANVVRRAGTGIGHRNFTPTSTCPTTDPSAFCYASDNVIDANRLEDIDCAISIIDGPCQGCPDVPPYRHQGAQFLAHVTNNVGVRPRDRFLCLPDPVPADLLVAGNVEETGGTTSTSTSSSTTISSSSSSSTSVSTTSVTTSSTSSTLSASTSTSTSTTTSTLLPRNTTTTLPVAERCLGASKLLLVDAPSRPTRRRLWVESQDVQQLVIGDGLDPAPLPTEGGSLRVTAVGGDEFDVTYPLSADGWKVIGPTDAPRGLRYHNPTGPITSVVFKAGRMLRVLGKGPQLEHRLSTEPDLVRVVLQVGPYWYRTEFGGNLQRFTAERRLLRKRALRPLDCGPNGLASPGAAFVP